MKIDATDISVVVQGSIANCTKECLLSVRKVLPKATIILSTWVGSKTDNLIFDQLILNKDPGFSYCTNEPNAKANNVNRQIVSTLSGLKVCKTKYVFKIRSDFKLTGNKFIDFFDKFPLSDNKYKLFEHKIISCCYFARNPQSNDPYPFHPSDLAFFGKTSDLLKLFDVPLMTEIDANYNKAKIGLLCKYVPEQHIFINSLKKNNFDVCCKYYNDNNPKAIEQTERYFASNFIFLDFNQFNLKPTKNEFNAIMYPTSFMSCYTHVEWQRLYKKYVDNNFNVPVKDNQRLHLEKMQRRYKKILAFSRIIAFPIMYRKLRREFRSKLLKFILNTINR